MKKKNFDCVEMKRRGAEEVREQIKNMSAAEELAFWRRETDELRRGQRQSRKSSGKSSG